MCIPIASVVALPPTGAGPTCMASHGARLRSVCQNWIWWIAP